MAISSVQALAIIRTVIESLHSLSNLDLLGEQVNKALAAHFPANAWLLLTQEASPGGHIIRSAVMNGRTQRKFHNTEIFVNGGLLKAAIDGNETIHVPAIQKDARFDKKHDVILGIEDTVENALLVPLVAGDKKSSCGLLALYDLQFVEDIEYHICFCETVGSAIASAIDYLQYIRDLKREALTDHLTGLHNRRALVSIVEREIEQCLRYDRDMSFALIDVDYFKSINDTDGHLHGDAVLVQLARILRKSVRRLDYVIRFAGDEFVILMPDTLEPQKGEVMRRLRENFEREKLPSSVEYSISIGSYSGSPQSLQHMFDKADKEMYKQKKERKSRARVATTHNAT